MAQGLDPKTLGLAERDLAYHSPSGSYTIELSHAEAAIYDVRESGFADDEAGRGTCDVLGRLLAAANYHASDRRIHLCVDYSTYRGNSNRTRRRLLREVISHPRLGSIALYGAGFLTRTTASLLGTVVPRLDVRHFDDRDAAMAYLRALPDRDDRRARPRLPAAAPLATAAEDAEPANRGDHVAQLIRHLHDDGEESPQLSLPADPDELRALARRQHEELRRHRRGLAFLIETVDHVCATEGWSADPPPLPDDVPDDDPLWTVLSTMHLMRSDIARMLAERERRTEDLAGARYAAEEASRAKSHFLGVVSHELRTPLHTITGLTERLSGQRLTREHKAAVRGIERSAHRLTRMVGELLDFTRLEAGALRLLVEPMDVESMLRELDDGFRKQAHERRLQLRLRRETGVAPFVYADRERLLQVLSNLVDNGLKFTDAGEVTVTLRRGEGDRVRVEVRDTGRGIEAADQRRVFEHFERGRQRASEVKPGVGLGLAIARQLVTLMGGDLTLHSAPGRGSTFHFEIAMPPAEPIDPSDTFDPDSLDLPLQGVRVLLVEDDPMALEFTERALVGAGARVRAYADPADALDTLEREGAALDVGVIDLLLPTMNGLECTAALRPLYPGLPVVLCSGNPPEDVADALERDPQLQFVQKPLRVATLIESIGAALAGARRN